MPESPWSITRRRFLALGAVGAGGVVLSGCGSSGKTAASTTTTSTTAKPGALRAARFFNSEDVLLPGVENRAPFGIGDDDGLLKADKLPDRVLVQILDDKDQPVGDVIEVRRHNASLPRPYYPLRFTVAKTGIYTAAVNLGSQVIGMPMQVVDKVPGIQPGTALPAVVTPTVADGRGVTPICTAEPQCPLHDVSLADALAAKRPIALLISTPKFCQVAICGPVLDVLLAAVASAPGVQFIHAEVYKDPAKSTDELTEVLQALGLTFEPCLLVAGADGKLVERLDNIFDADELAATLTRIRP